MNTAVTLRRTTVLGHFTFAILTILAAYFWQERTLILDAAFQSYHFIAAGQPAIMVERFGAVLVQGLPLMGVWAGASLTTVLLLYSISIVLFHWAAFSICLHGLKDTKAALAILLFNVLLVGDAFYWMQNELLQAITLQFVLWSLWLRRVDWARFTPWDWVLTPILATTVAYYHPLVFFSLAFCWMFFWLGNFKGRLLLAIAGLFALIFASKYVLRQPNFYDRGMTGQYVREFNFSLERLLQSQSLHDFSAHLGDNFLLLLPALVVITGYYVWKRLYWKLALVWFSVCFYCLLILQRFLADDRWYIQESHYQALAVFLIVPLLWDVLPGAGDWLKELPASRAHVLRRARSGVFVLALLLLGTRLVGIWNTHQPYTERLSYVRSLVEQTKPLAGRKFVVGENQVDRKKMLMYWGLPFETVQITALESPDAMRVLAIGKNPDSLAAQLSPDSMVQFLMIPGHAFRELPRDYYRMPDSAGYRAILLR